MTIIRRILLGGMVVSVLCCSLTFAFAAGIWGGIPGHLTRNSVEVYTVARTITDFSLPTGYSTDYALDLLGFALAAYKGGDGHSHIILAQAPRWVYAERFLPLADQQGDKTGELTAIRDEQRFIRDQDVTVTISEGVNGDGQPYRQLSMVFEGKGGTALLVMNETTSRWDRETVDAFLASFN
jgi:hypothetical protein